MSAAYEWMDYSERMLRAGDREDPGRRVRPDRRLARRRRPEPRCPPARRDEGDRRGRLDHDRPDRARTRRCRPASTFRSRARCSSARYYAVRTILLDEVTFPEHVPQNDGVFRPVKVIAPKGTIFNPSFPRACFSRFMPDAAGRRQHRSSRSPTRCRTRSRPATRPASTSARTRASTRRGRVLALPRGERGLVRRPVRQGRDGLGRQPDGEHAQQPDRGARHALPGPLRPVRAAARARRARQVARRASASSGGTASSSTARTRARATGRPTRRGGSSAAGTGSSPPAGRTRTPRARRSCRRR